MKLYLFTRVCLFFVGAARLTMEIVWPVLCFPRFPKRPLLFSWFFFEVELNFIGRGGNRSGLDGAVWREFVGCALCLLPFSGAISLGADTLVRWLVLRSEHWRRTGGGQLLLIIKDNSVTFANLVVAPSCPYRAVAVG